MALWAAGKGYRSKGDAVTKKDYNGHDLTPADMKRIVQKFYKNKHRRGKEVQGAGGLELTSEHKDEMEVGDVHHMFVDKDYNLWNVVRFSPTNKKSQEYSARVKSGHKKQRVGLSYDYKSQKHTWDKDDKSVIKNKSVRKLSVVDHPAYDEDDTYITLWADTEEELLKNLFEEIYGPSGDDASNAPYFIANELKNRATTLLNSTSEKNQDGMEVDETGEKEATTAASTVKQKEGEGKGKKAKPFAVSKNEKESKTSEVPDKSGESKSKPLFNNTGVKNGKAAKSSGSLAASRSTKASMASEENSDAMEVDDQETTKVKKTATKTTASSKNKKEAPPAKVKKVAKPVEKKTKKAQQKEEEDDIDEGVPNKDEDAEEEDVEDVEMEEGEEEQAEEAEEAPPKKAKKAAPVKRNLKRPLPEDDDMEEEKETEEEPDEKESPNEEDIIMDEADDADANQEEDDDVTETAAKVVSTKKQMTNAGKAKTTSAQRGTITQRDAEMQQMAMRDNMSEIFKLRGIQKNPKEQQKFVDALVAKELQRNQELVTDQVTILKEMYKEQGLPASHLTQLASAAQRDPTTGAAIREMMSVAAANYGASHKLQSLQYQQDRSSSRGDGKPKTIFDSNGKTRGNSIFSKSSASSMDRASDALFSIFTNNGQSSSYWEQPQQPAYEPPSRTIIKNASKQQQQQQQQQRKKEVSHAAHPRLGEKTERVVTPEEKQRLAREKREKDFAEHLGKVQPYRISRLIPFDAKNPLASIRTEEGLPAIDSLNLREDLLEKVHQNGYTHRFLNSFALPNLTAVEKGEYSDYGHDKINASHYTIAPENYKRNPRRLMGGLITLGDENVDTLVVDA